MPVLVGSVRWLRSRPPASPAEVSRRAEAFLSSWPQRAPDHNVTFYVAEVADVMAEYPLETIIAACKSLVRSSKWIPSVAEVAEALAEKNAELFTRPAYRGEALIARYEKAQQPQPGDGPRVSPDQLNRLHSLVKRLKFGAAT